MSVDEVAVLRAAGLESAAKVIEAARAGAVEAQPTPRDGADLLRDAGAEDAALALEASRAAAQAAEQPSGLTKEQLDSMSRDEVLARMDEVDEALRRGV
jgi:hypothetical protein